MLSLLPAVLVLVVALGLRRGRAFAWWAAIVVHLVLTVFGVALVLLATRAGPSDLAPALGPNNATIGTLAPLVQPLLVLLVLFATRGAFTVPAPRGTYVRAVGALTCTLGAAFGLYVVVGTALRSGFDTAPSTVQLARDFPLRLVPAGYLGLVEPTFLPVAPLTTVLFEWTGIAVWSVAVVLVLRTFTRTRCPGSDSTAAAAARALLLEHGDHSLAYLTTWLGHSYWFSADGQSYVAYRMWGGVALTTGDPVGPAADTRRTVEGFVEFCLSNGWTPCLYSVTAETTHAATGLG